jgi:lipopolysaccharide transport system permease protein
MTASAQHAPAASPPVTVIRPTSGWIPPRLDELWTYRELLFFLIWREIKVRYAQTLLGAVWTVFQPLAMMLVYTYAFTQLAKINTEPIPYPLYALSGLAVWTFVSRAVFQGASSLVNDVAIVTKTPAPRLIIPLAAVISMFVDFVITLGLLLVFSFGYGLVPPKQFVFVPVIIALAFLLALGLSLLLSTLNVRYRDVGQALPFVLQLWFFLSPVAFPLLTPGGTSWITVVQALNPAVGIILVFRWATLGAPAPHGLLVASVVVTLAILAAGLAYFARAERTIADDI